MTTSRTPRQEIVNTASNQLAHSVRKIAAEFGWDKTSQPADMGDYHIVHYVDFAAKIHASAAMTRYLEGLTVRAEAKLNDDIRRHATGIIKMARRLDLPL